jgi:hypothetical protein
MLDQANLVTGGQKISGGPSPIEPADISKSSVFEEWDFFINIPNLDLSSNEAQCYSFGHSRIVLNGSNGPTPYVGAGIKQIIVPLIRDDFTRIKNRNRQAIHVAYIESFVGSRSNVIVR